MFKRILLKKNRSRRFRLQDSAPEVGRWLTEGSGQSLLEAEKAALAAELDHYCGYHLMEIGISDQLQFSSSSPIQHCFRLNPLGNTPAKSGLLGALQALPIESESIDLVLLHHVIEYSAYPHQVLREVSRVLIPRGHAVVVVFNRWSLVGLWKSLLGFSRNARHRNFSTLTANRLCDWSELLDMEPVSIQHLYFGLPVKSSLGKRACNLLESLGQRLGLPFGGAFILTLQKNVNATTPLKPEWRFDAAARFRGFGQSAPVPGSVPVSAVSKSGKKVIH